MGTKTSGQHRHPFHLWEIKKRSPIMGTKTSVQYCYCLRPFLLKKDPQSWGRKRHGKRTTVTSSRLIKKRSPIMGTKTFSPSPLLYTPCSRLKKDPQSWGRKLANEFCFNLGFTNELKKDPQSWGRKRCRTLYNAGIQVIKKRSPIMGTKTYCYPSWLGRPVLTIKKRSPIMGTKTLAQIFAVCTLFSPIKKRSPIMGTKTLVTVRFTIQCSIKKRSPIMGTKTSKAIF